MEKTPRQRRKVKNKNTILDATKKHITKYGIENISLREIAKTADYSPAALYKYFDNKEGIVQAVKERENLQLIEQLETIDTALPPTQRLVELCMQYIQFNLKNPVYLTLVNSLTSHRRSKQDVVSSSSPYRIFMEAVDTWIKSENIQPSKKFGSEDITYSLWAMIHGMATLRLSQLKDFEADFESTNRRSIEIYLQGIRGNHS